MKRILVIDDNENIIDVIEEVLSFNGVKVEVAFDGNEGIKKYHSKDFDLVITDINMPNGNGNEVCEQIRKSNRPHTPVIAMSGTPWTLSGNHFDTVIRKPFSLKFLFDQIKKFLSDFEHTLFLKP